MNERNKTLCIYSFRVPESFTIKDKFLIRHIGEEKKVMWSSQKKGLGKQLGGQTLNYSCVKLLNLEYIVLINHIV